MLHMLTMFLVLLYTISLQTISACEIYRFEATDLPLALQGHVIKTISANHISSCWSKCVWLPWCLSINVRKTAEEYFTCELNNSSKTANLSKLVIKQGWTYHEMKDISQQLCATYECKRKEDLGNGWYRYGNASIKLFTDKKNWTDARSHCQSLGGDLLSITSSHENDFIYDVFVQNLNLTYMQEDKGIATNKIMKHVKLNGDDPDVILLGTSGDAEYKQDGREKALYLNGRQGCAKLPTIPITTGSYTISFWLKALNHTQDFVVPMNVYDPEAHPKIVEFIIKSSTNDLTFNVKHVDGTVSAYGTKQLPLNQWSFITFSWVAGSKTMRSGYQGSFFLALKTDEASPVITDKETWVLGVKSQAELSVQKAFHGYLKHVIVSTNLGLKEHEVQTTMYWHEQGVWIGLNDLSGTNLFSWSDGSPVSFSNLPSYNPLPVKSGRKCAGIGKDHIWLDKLCHLKYPYLCEKAAPS